MKLRFCVLSAGSWPICVSVMVAVQTTQLSSSYNLVVVTLNRYLAVTDPAACRHWFSGRKSLCISLLIWACTFSLTALLYISPQKGLQRFLHVFGVLRVQTKLFSQWQTLHPSRRKSPLAVFEQRAKCTKHCKVCRKGKRATWDLVCVADSYCGMCRYELVWGLDRLVTLTVTTVVIPLLLMSVTYVKLLFVIKRQVGSRTALRCCSLQRRRRCYQ